MTIPDEIFKKTLTSKPDKETDALWAGEAESRIDAYERGKIKAVALEKVLKKYKRDAVENGLDSF